MFPNSLILNVNKGMNRFVQNKYYILDLITIFWWMLTGDPGCLLLAAERFYSKSVKIWLAM